MDCEIVLYFNQLLTILNRLQIIWLGRGNLKVCKMKVLNLFLHQVIVLIQPKLYYFNSPKFRVKSNGKKKLMRQVLILRK